MTTAARKPVTYFKNVSASRAVRFNYQGVTEVIDSGLSVVSGTISAQPSGLTISTPTVEDNKVIAQVSGGTVGVTYGLICLATMDNGSIVDMPGILVVDGFLF